MSSRRRCGSPGISTWPRSAFRTDAYARALTTWPERGVPAKPGAWLTTVARNRALDVLRRRSTQERLIPLLVEQTAPSESWLAGHELAGHELAGHGLAGHDEIPDDRLRLIFTCCHPALAAEAQVALTLRLICGLSTAEVARSFLVSEPTMAARITRAKRKIAAARVPYRVPQACELASRTEAVLAVVHLLFTTGHTAPRGADSSVETWSSDLWTSRGCCAACCPEMPTWPACWP
jgi:RNA polymerase sigma factor (sigma-70 family)